MAPPGSRPDRGRPEPIPTGDALARLQRAVENLTAELAEGDLDAPVPGCPGWRLRDLAEHVVEIHDWAWVALDRPGRRSPDVPPIKPLPADRDGLVGRFEVGADRLLRRLRETPPDQPRWGFGPPPRTAAFWLRRQLHETAMHAWDAANASGRAPVGPPDWEPRLAADGIDEVVTMFFPRQVRLGRIAPLPATLTLLPDDVGVGWRLAGDGTGPATSLDGPADAEIRGPVVDLLLLIWGRAALDQQVAAGTTRLIGDPAAARAVLSAGLTP